MESQSSSRLVLTWQRSQLDVEAHERIMMGRDRGAEIRLDGDYVSRAHLELFHEDHYFVIRDRSTNGTLIQSEDSTVVHCKRGQVRLWGQGWISLGAPLARETAVHYRVVSAR
ncbi:MAG: FHA domain-containing protein [Pseudomonadota bacterium]